MALEIDYLKALLPEQAAEATITHHQFHAWHKPPK